MAKKVKLTPQEIADKQIRNVANNTEGIRKGIMAVTESPTAAAARNLSKMKANFNKAIDDGTVEAGLKKVTLSDWQDAAITKGVDRIVPGLEAARSKLESFHQKLSTHINSGLNTLDAMPKQTISDSKARMNAWFDHMSKMKK